MNDTLRLKQVNFLRFIAIFAVFMFHASIWPITYFPLKNAAAEAVSFFFILSGFLSGFSSYPKNIIPNCKNIAVYIKNKICKIYPLYFWASIFTVFYSSIPVSVSYLRWDIVRENLVQLAKCLLLIQSWFDKNYFAFAGTGWFLSVLFFLYLFCLPVIWGVKKLLAKNKGTIITLALFILIMGLTVLYNSIMRDSNVEFWEYIFPPARLGEYFGGIICGCLWRKHYDKLSKLSVLWATVLEIGALVFWVYVLYTTVPAWTYRVVYWLIPNFIVITIFALGRGYISYLFSTKYLHDCGNISFELFILHPIVIHVYMYISLIERISFVGNLFSVISCFLLSVMFAVMARRLTFSGLKK